MVLIWDVLSRGIEARISRHEHAIVYVYVPCCFHLMMRARKVIV